MADIFAKAFLRGGIQILRRKLVGGVALVWPLTVRRAVPQSGG